MSRGPPSRMMFPPFSALSFATIFARSPFMSREFAQSSFFNRCERQTFSTLSRNRE